MNLLELANKEGVNAGLIYNFIEEGGAEFVNKAFVELMIEEMTRLDFMDKKTPVGAVAHSRDMIASIFNNFKEEFDKANPQ